MKKHKRVDLDLKGRLRKQYPTAPPIQYKFSRIFRVIGQIYEHLKNSLGK